MIFPGEYENLRQFAVFKTAHPRQFLALRTSLSGKSWTAPAMLKWSSAQAAIFKNFKENAYKNQI